MNVINVTSFTYTFLLRQSRRRPENNSGRKKISDAAVQFIDLIPAEGCVKKRATTCGENISTDVRVRVGATFSSKIKSSSFNLGSVLGSHGVSAARHV